MSWVLSPAGCGECGSCGVGGWQIPGSGEDPGIEEDDPNRRRSWCCFPTVSGSRPAPGHPWELIPSGGKPAAVREGPGFDGESKGRFLEFAFSKGNGRRFSVGRFSGPGKKVISLGWPWRTGSGVGDGRGRKGFGDPCVGRVARVGSLGRQGPRGSKDGFGALVFSGGPGQGLSCGSSCCCRGVVSRHRASFSALWERAGLGKTPLPSPNLCPGSPPATGPLQFRWGNGVHFSESRRRRAREGRPSPASPRRASVPAVGFPRVAPSSSSNGGVLPGPCFQSGLGKKPIGGRHGPVGGNLRQRSWMAATPAPVYRAPME